jgi:selenoprotein W-related protein
VDKAARLAENLLKKYKKNVSSFEMVPSEDGAFELFVNDCLIFSKKEKKRFPKKHEIQELIGEKDRM